MSDEPKTEQPAEKTETWAEENERKNKEKDARQRAERIRLNKQVLKSYRIK
jgi:hypothetical protein